MIDAEKLWNDYLSGVESAFTELVLFYEKEVFLYIFSMTEDKSLSQDIEQEVWIKLYRSNTNIDHFKSYIFRTAKNATIDHIRKQRNTVSLNSASILADNYNKSDQFEFTEDFEKLLDKKDRELWSLHMEGFNNEEIAKILDSTPKSIANKKSIIKKYLQEKLRKSNLWMIILMIGLN